MSHEIETMMYARETPWHGLGTYVGDEDVDSTEAIKAAGLDWVVKKFPAVARWRSPNGKENVVESPDQFLVVRASGHGYDCLGTVGKNYRTLQNLEAFQFCDSLVENGEVRYHTAGALQGGKRVWLLAKLKNGDFEVVPGDKQEQFLLLTNSHDGTSAVRVFFTSVRVVCANTLRMALTGVRDGVSIRHTGDVKAKLEDARKALGLARVNVQKYREVCTRLAGLKMDGVAARAFLETLIPDPEGASPARARSKRADLLELFHGAGAGSDLEGVKGTRWGMLNAVTEFTSHKAGRRQEKRLNSAWFGTGHNLNSKAASLLLST